MAAVLLRLLLRKESIPQAGNSWSGSEKPIGGLGSEAKPYGSKAHITGKGLEHQDNIDLDKIPHNIRGWDCVGRCGLCNDHRTRTAQVVVLLSNFN